MKYCKRCLKIIKKGGKHTNYCEVCLYKIRLEAAQKRRGSKYKILAYEVLNGYRK